MALYPDTCGATAQEVQEVTTIYGTGLYALDCPCYNKNGSNVFGQDDRPGFLAPGLANPTTPTTNPVPAPTGQPPIPAPTPALTSTPTTNPTPAPTPQPIPAPTSQPIPEATLNPSQTTKKKPNFIVCQPDDLRFFEEWTPPPHLPRNQVQQIEVYPSTGLPNIERLRTEGIQMMQGYAASPMCATSRYSTLTGRYPSRSAINRMGNLNNDVSRILVSNTKLQDVTDIPDGNDCSENNLATVLKQNGYRTGVTGKWHLGDDNNDYEYSSFQDHVRSCGFDFAESLYAENLGGRWTSNSDPFSHNMEYMAEKAIEFIQQTDDDSPFFLYFNPTVPHSSGNVVEALTDFNCRQTSAGTLSRDPQVKGMTDENTSCEQYRQTVLDRAAGATDNNKVGSIWIDDAIGALLTALEDSDQLDNTFFLFQMDHGQEGKGTLWEPGSRLAQFVRYPDSNFEPNTKFHGMVSTIDIAPTILDYAGIVDTTYDMDGISWRKAVERGLDEMEWNSNRCLFQEIEFDRSIRCGCYKYMELNSNGNTYSRGSRRYGLDVGTEVLYDLCTNEGIYDVTNNAETNNIKNDLPSKVTELEQELQCHIEKTRANRAVMDFEICGPSYVFVEEEEEEEDQEGGGGGISICFSGETTVQVKEKGSIKMRELQIGDQVLIANDKNTKLYDTVYSFGHREDDVMGTYLRLLPSKLELSSDHMIYVRGNEAPIPASMVQVGDILSDGSRVDTILSSIRRKGMYAPFTTSGTLLVNGVLVSNYIAFQSSSTLNIGKSMNTSFTFQWLAHAFNTPQRLWWRFHCYSSTIINEPSHQKFNNGISRWVEIPLRLTYWLLDQIFLLQFLFLMPIIIVFSFLTAVESIFLVTMQQSPSFLALFIIIGIMRLRSGSIMFITTEKKVGQALEM